MKQVAILLAVVLSALPTVLVAQSAVLSQNVFNERAALNAGTDAGTFDAGSGAAAAGLDVPILPNKPFSRVALGVGLSPLGVGLQLTTNINNYLNLRGQGNIFNYSTNFTTNGFVSSASLNLDSFGAALDLYPFQKALLFKGFRVSPGLLLYNGNQLTASSNVPGGTSFTLNDQNYYSQNANPLTASGSLSLHTTQPAFTITTGFGNQIPRKGHHLSFPFEIGIAASGAPALNVNLAGSACYDQAQTQCAPVTGNNPLATQVQSNLAAQVTKWNSDLNPLKVYPIISIGAAYAFHLR